MAPFETFADPIRYYDTLGHEVVGHWTGHESRLNRNLSGKFGSRAYAAEECVAEIASALMCAKLGLEPVVSEHHAAYIATWIKLFEDHPKSVFTAASMAQRAVEYVKGLQPQASQQAPGVGI
jgi:antirestriction protein ArdC